MAVAELQRGLDRLHADVPLQGHGAKADLRNTASMGFNDLHYDLLGHRLEWGSRMGGEECPLAARAANRVGSPQRSGRRFRGAESCPAKIKNIFVMVASATILCTRKLLATVLTLE